MGTPERHFPFHARVYGRVVHGVGYGLYWHLATGTSELVGFTPSQTRRAYLRMRRAWEAERGRLQVRS